MPGGRIPHAVNVSSSIGDKDKPGILCNTRRVKPGILAACEQLAEVKCNILAYPNVMQVDSVNPVSVVNFFETDLSRNAVALKLPRHSPEAYLQHYFECKAKAPSSTCAIIFAPDRTKSVRVNRELARMPVLGTFPPGNTLLCDEQGNALHHTCTIKAYLDAPGCVMRRVNLHQEHGLSFRLIGRIAGTSVSFLLDTGATASFVGEALVKRLGLRIQPAMGSLQVEVADGKTVSSLGTCTIHFKIQGYVGSITLYVLPAMTSNCDVILGEDWMWATGAVLDYNKGTCTLKKPKRSIVLKPESQPQPRNETGSSANGGHYVVNAIRRAANGQATADANRQATVISAAKALRLIRKGAHGLMVMVEDLAKPKSQTKDRYTGTWMCSPKAVRSVVFAADGSSRDNRAEGLIKEFSDVFADLPSGLPPERDVGHVIKLTPEASPQFRPIYRLSPLEMEELKKQITKLLEQGFIQPSSSPWGAPILFVAKADGSLRMCTDYRALNKVTQKDRYPLPRIDDLFDQLQGAKHFSSLDLQQGYYQVRISDEDAPKTAFRTPLGHFQWRVLNFGLTNAPATFMRLMNAVLAPFIGKFVLVYLDDILIYSKTEAEHRSHIRSVLQALRQHKLYAKLSKCEFFEPELKFLGHIVGQDGIKVDPAKVQVLATWPPLKSPADVRSFLGLANYFRKYIRGYSATVAPLIALTKDRAEWTWDEPQRMAFEALKNALSNAPVLIIPDLNEPFTVVSDASMIASGAVLLQDGRVVAYTSKKFSPAEINYGTGEQEMLGVVNALKEWRCYLEGAKHTVLVTDHNPNTFFSNPGTPLSRRQARWLEFLSRFHYEWKHIPGRTNFADPITRQYIENQPQPALAVHRCWLAGSIIHVFGQRMEDAATGTQRVVPLQVNAVQTRSRTNKLSQSTQPREPSSKPVGSQVHSQTTHKHGEGSSPQTNARRARGPPHKKPSPHKSDANPDNGSASGAQPNGSQQSEGLTTRAQASDEEEGFPENFLDAVRAAYAHDPWFIRKKWRRTKGLSQDSTGLWRKGCRIVVPDSRKLKELILTDCHETPMSGHAGIDRTVARLRERWWWRNMYTDAVEHVHSCDSCQRNKAQRMKPSGLLQPLPIPERRWGSVSVDFITGLPLTANGYDSICVCVDRLSKMTHFTPTTKDVNAEEFANLFFDVVVRLHGVPNDIVSDRGSVFTSAFFRQLCQRMGWKQKLSTAYHPQTDGQTERMNSVLEDMLRHYVDATCSNWDTFLSSAEFAANSAVNASTGFSPFKVMYGEQPLTPMVLEAPRVPLTKADQVVETVDEVVKLVRKALVASQQRHKIGADRSRRDVSFEVGDYVLLSTRNLRLRVKGDTKLLPKFVGPLRIAKRIGKVAYRLELPPLWKVHDVFHVSLLRKYVARGSVGHIATPPIEWLEGEPVYEVEQLLDHTDVKVNRKTVRRFLVKWMGYDHMHNSWEQEANLLKCDEVLREYWERYNRSRRT